MYIYLHLFIKKQNPKHIYVNNTSEQVIIKLKGQCEIRLSAIAPFLKISDLPQTEFAELPHLAGLVSKYRLACNEEA